MDRIVILFLPSLLGLLWQDDPGISVAWSLAGSVFIAVIAQTRWFREPEKIIRRRRGSADANPPLTHRLLRPLCMFHFFFIGFHVIGGAFSTLEVSGYEAWRQVGGPSEYELSLNATAQGLMLLGQAGVTVGMKLAGLQYGPPQYVIPYLPPYSLIVLSFVSLGVGNVFAFVPGLEQIRERLLAISAGAILIEFFLAVRRHNSQSLLLAFSLLGFNLVSQILSGWKGLVLWTIITLGALLYPLMPRRVLLGGTTFVLFWALYLHPFGLAFRPLIWYEGVDRETAVAISIDQAINMSLDQRLDTVWEMMVGRANDLYQFRKYIEYVPNIRPYFGFDLVNEALVTFVPRILWPGKPDLGKIAMQRVYEAGIVREGTTISAKSNLYQDSYLSGGWIAVLLTSFTFGFIIMTISHACERFFGGYGIGTCLIFTSLFGPVVQSAPNLIFLVGTVWISLLTMFSLFQIGRGMGWIVPAHTPARMRAPQSMIV